MALEEGYCKCFADSWDLEEVAVCLVIANKVSGNGRGLQLHLHRDAKASLQCLTAPPLWLTVSKIVAKVGLFVCLFV